MGYVILVLVGAFALPASAAAVNRSGPSGSTSCHVVGSAKLLAGAGGADAICTEVQHAIAERAAGVSYNAEVRIISPSRLAAAITVEGRTLPVQNFAVMDGRLTPESIKRFAASIGAAVGEALKG